jgi:hypothetical protein
MLHFSRRSLGNTVIAVFVLAPITTYAEVSDKEPSIFCVWVVGVIASAACFLGSYCRRWLAPVLAIVPAIWFASLIVEIHSSDVGPAMYREQGFAYYVHTYLAFAFAMSGSVLGWLVNNHRSPYTTSKGS